MQRSAKDKLKVLFISSETSPFSKSGGLGEVVAALPKELCRQGVDCRVVTPKYRSIPEHLLKGLEFRKAYEVNLSWRKQQAAVYELTSEGVTNYFIGNDYFFSRDGYYGYGDDHERFAFFSKAAVMLPGELDFKPDIIHAHDWQTGLACVYLRDMLRGFTFYRDVRSLFTIHNLQYQGVFPRECLSSLDLNDGYFSLSGLEFYNNVSLLKAGIIYADKAGTVSPTYAKEIRTPAYGYSMDGVIRQREGEIVGIINGIDYDKKDPARDPDIYERYTAEDALIKKKANKVALRKDLKLPEAPNAPLFSIITRLADQKGLDILAVVMEEFLSKDVQLAVLGQGDGHYEQLMNYFQWKYPEKFYIHLGFDTMLAQRIYAASDFFLMPSLFEPCGLGQMTAMRYGTLPIVRNTGGLADTVRPFGPDNLEGNGFVFNDYIASGLMWAINKALECYGDQALMERAVKNAMACDCSWTNSAKRYIELYTSMKA